MKYLTILILYLTLSLADESTEQEFTNANNLFAATVYKEILKNNKANFLVSPFSAEIVLAFAQFGCKEETAQEIRTSLYLSNDNNKVRSVIKSLLSTLTIIGSEFYTLRTASKIYINDNFPIKKEFKRIVPEIYGVVAENIDFTKKIESARKINDCVEIQTENKIQNLINQDSLNNKTKAVLVNSLYFKGNWSNPFALVYTNNQHFYKTAKDIVLVETMHNSYGNHYKYYESPRLDAKFLEIPFKSEDISMTIILPNEKEGINALENQIDKVLIPHNLTWEVVNVALPKFKIESEIDFKAILQNLGVNKAFNKNEADLSGIAGGKGDLIIDKIAQKTFIDVNEEGVEAAAATFALVVVPPSVLADRPKEFIADHPFIFYIKIKNLIIFAGRVSVPNLLN